MTVTEQISKTQQGLRLAGLLAGWSALLALVALLVAVFVVPRAVGAETLTVLSGSMRPVLDPGDLVVVRQTAPEDIGVGSIVTFQMKSGEPAVTTHRVVSQGVDKKGHAVFLTQGDGNETADQVWIREEQLRGTVWYAVPYVGYVAQAIPSDLRGLLAGAVGGGLLVYALTMIALGVRDWKGARHA